MTPEDLVPVLSLAWFAGGLVDVFMEGVPVVGFAHGVLNGVALKEGPAGLGLIGIMITLFVLVALISALVVSCLTLMDS